MQCGVSASKLETLPTWQISTRTPSTECLICLSEYEPGDTVSLMMSCNCTPLTDHPLGQGSALHALLPHQLCRPVAQGLKELSSDQDCHFDAPLLSWVVLCIGVQAISGVWLWSRLSIQHFLTPASLQRGITTQLHMW